MKLLDGDGCILTRFHLIKFNSQTNNNDRNLSKYGAKCSRIYKMDGAHCPARRHNSHLTNYKLAIVEDKMHKIV